jgi:hypothetical protein
MVAGYRSDTGKYYGILYAILGYRFAQAQEQVILRVQPDEYKIPECQSFDLHDKQLLEAT